MIRQALSLLRAERRTPQRVSHARACVAGIRNDVPLLDEVNRKGDACAISRAHTVGKVVPNGAKRSCTTLQGSARFAGEIKRPTEVSMRRDHGIGAPLLRQRVVSLEGQPVLSATCAHLVTRRSGRDTGIMREGSPTDRLIIPEMPRD